MNKFAFYYPEGHQAHFESGHPERPERIEVLRESLMETGWWEAFPHLEPLPLERGFLERIHTPSYLDSVKRLSRTGARLDMDTYTTSASWQLALNAAGGAAAIAEEVWSGRTASGFALTRPPGHHATPGRGMGFCLLNNVALAAEYLLAEPQGSAGNAEKLTIIDLDLHHGNGTQEIFWDRSDVLYISTHQYPHYPGTGDLTETGVGPGLGYTANFPLPPFTGDHGFRELMGTLILPLLERYRPQMLLVSFGFDPHWRDPLGHLMLSAAGYGELIADLANWAQDNAQGRIALFLEGGYDLDAGAACAQTVTAALLGEPIIDPIGPAPQAEGSSWKNMVDRARQIWEV